jgi:hypothetical protein
MIIRDSILILLCVLVISIGLFGNTISIFIFKNKDLRKYPPAFYLITLSFVNIIGFLVLLFVVFQSIWAHSDFSCKLFTTFLYPYYEFQSFLIAFCALDRLITVFRPFNYLFKNKLNFQLPFLLITLTVLVCLSSLFSLYFKQETTFENQTICLLPNEPQWLFNYMQSEFILFRTVIPLVIMVISSVLIFWKIRKNKKKFRILNINQKKDQQMGIVLIVTDFIFLLFRFPNLINVLLNRNSNNFFNSICVIISSLHSALEFVVYLIFNNVYRNLFIKLMKKIRKYLKINNQVSFI